MKNTAPIKHVKSAVRTMALFTVFAEKKRPLSLAELADALSAPKSSCYELLQTLVHLRYILIIDGGNSYYPSRQLWEKAEQIDQFNPTKEKVENELKRLRDSIGETIFIGRFQGEQVAYSQVFDGRHTIRYTASSGELRAVHASALGKALLASVSDEERKRLLTTVKLSRFNENTITTKKALLDDLEKGAQQGIYIAVGERLADVMELAIPVKIQGHLLAIGMAGPSQRMQKNRERYGSALMASAAAITD